MDILDEIAYSISELKKVDDISRMINQAVDRDILPIDIIEKGIRKGLDIVGKKYEEESYFLAELLFATEIASEASGIIKKYLKKENMETKGKIILGTVRGDMHDIGKNIFGMLASASGFEVIDLGVDVDPDSFIINIKNTGAQILAMSALLTTTLNEMGTVVNTLQQSSLRGNVKVLLGGNAASSEFGESIGADSTALNAVQGLETCKKWVKKNE